MTERFDAVALSWDEKPRRIELASHIRNTMLPYLKKEDSVLDFGCGTGLISLGLSDTVTSLTGVDLSATMLSVLEEKKKHLNITNYLTLSQDILKEPLKERFDVIITSMACHHVEDIEALFSAFKKLLNPQGGLLIADLEEEDGEFHSDNEGVHHFGFSKEKITSLYEKEGFIDIEYRRIHSIEKTKPYGIFLSKGRLNG